MWKLHQAGLPSLERPVLDELANVHNSKLFMTDSLPSNERVLSEKAVENITRAEELAYELRINEVMTRSVKIITPEMKMKDVVEIFRQAHISGAPVVLNGDLVGVLSLEDVIRCLVQIRHLLSCQQVYDDQGHYRQSLRPGYRSIKNIRQHPAGPASSPR